MHGFIVAFYKSAILHICFTSFHVEQAINFDVGSLTLHGATGRASQCVLHRWVNSWAETKIWSRGLKWVVDVFSIFQDVFYLLVS